MTEAPAPQRSSAFVISQIYYYVAAVIGAAFLIGGAIATLFGLRTLILPREFETARDGVRTILHGLAFALPGLAVMWWHLRAARRGEDRASTEAFWGRALYFFLMALVALIFLLVGLLGVLNSLVDAALPAADAFAETGESPEATSLRNALDFVIFVIVAGPVFWWHLRQGRRTVSGETSAA